MTAFVEVCSHLLRDVPSIQALAVEANIGVELVNWNGTPRAIWSSVLAEEKNQNRLGTIFRLLVARYPENEELWEVGLRYVSRSAKGGETVTLSEVATNTSDMLNALQHFQESMRAEMREMEGRINRRIDDRMGQLTRKFDATLANVNVMTPVKRYAWVLAFLLFTVPMPLFLEEVRASAGIHWRSVVGMAVVFWAVAAALFLYGLGMIRDR